MPKVYTEIDENKDGTTTVTFICGTWPDHAWPNQYVMYKKYKLKHDSKELIEKIKSMEPKVQELRNKVIEQRKIAYEAIKKEFKAKLTDDFFHADLNLFEHGTYDFDMEYVHYLTPPKTPEERKEAKRNFSYAKMHEYMEKHADKKKEPKKSAKKSAKKEPKKSAKKEPKKSAPKAKKSAKK